MIRGLVCAVSATAILSAASCSGNSASSSSSSSASITAVGSTALLPLVKQAATDYQTKHPDAKISVSGGGSMTGVTQAAQKGADIGDSDVLPVHEPSLVDHQVAVVAFALAVNPAARVKNLSSAQIRGIFSGKIKNWKAVGGADQPITIINRPKSSGTRAVFVSKIMQGAQPTDAGLTQDSSGTVAAMVAQTGGAVSYLAAGYVKPGEQVAVSIDGVPPTDANVESGKYALWSYEYMLTNGQPSAQIADFINFVKEDKPLLARLHFIAVGDMKLK
ncbi:MAG: phosphate ABC transporter substrate-binding protein [Candidatus Baltobacteraceae bacterium]